MDWLVDRVFPFRRLTVWLGLLVLVVSALALTFSYLLVIASLEDSLVSNRVSITARAAETSAPTFATNFANALSGSDGSPDTNAVTLAYGSLTNTDAAVYQVIADGRLVPVTTLAPPTPSSVAVAAAEANGVQSGVGTASGRRVGEAAYRMRISGTQYVVVLQSSLEDIDSTVKLTSRRSLLGALIALPLAVIIGALAAALLTRRIRRLERASSRIADGNLSEPIVDRGKDEIGGLAVALDQMRNELASTDVARRTFVANASHELRTPVFALSGFLELLIDEEDEAMRKQFLATMQDQVERLTRLATDLLDLSRLDAGKFVVVREPVELAEAAERIALDLTPVANRRGATIVIGAVVAAGALWMVERNGVSAWVNSPSLPRIYQDLRADREAAYAWIRANTPADANFLTYEDPALRRHTGRHGLGIHCPTRFFYANDTKNIFAFHDDLIRSMPVENLQYVLIGPNDLAQDINAPDREKILKDWRTRPDLRTVYENPRYQIRQKLN